jgi:type II secretory pathway pseudopilin PulG
MMYFLSQKRSMTHGFSLVEAMVYIAVLVFVAGALVTTFLSLDTVLLRNKTERELTESARVSLERMVRDMRAADGINTSLSTFGVANGALTLTEGATTTRFYLSGGDVVMSVNGTELGPLTSNNVTVESFFITRFVGTHTEMVRVALTLSASSKAASSTRTYYTSAVLRGTYE